MTGSGPTVKRTVFSTPRSAEFLELQALQSQTGQYAEDFGHVVVKELLDNALDAAETASRTPVVDIATRTDKYNEITFVTVSDNGAGITPATVAGLCDFTMLVSDKARYRGPTRGAQGNAFKTLLGIPFALGLAEPVVIESAGVRHELRVTVNPLGGVDPAANPTTKTEFFTNPQVRHGRSGRRRCRRRRTGTTCPRSPRWSTATSAPGSTCRSGGSSASSRA